MEYKANQHGVENAICLLCQVKMKDTNYEIEDLPLALQFALVEMRTKEYKVIECPRCEDLAAVIVSTYDDDYCPY